MHYDSFSGWGLPTAVLVPPLNAGCNAEARKLFDVQTVTLFAISRNEESEVVTKVRIQNSAMIGKHQFAPGS